MFRYGISAAEVFMIRNGQEVQVSGGMPESAAENLVNQQAKDLVEMAVNRARSPQGAEMPPRPEGAAPVTSVQLDIVWPDEWQGANQHLATTANLQRTTQEWAMKFGCRAKLLKKSGPGGGNPEFEFTGEEENLRKLVMDYAKDMVHGDTAGSAEEAYYLLYGDQ